MIWWPADNPVAQIVVQSRLQTVMRLGTLDQSPLIQIKQTAPGEATVRGRLAERSRAQGRRNLSEQMHPAAPHHLPFFIPGADGSDTLMVVMGLFLIATVLWVGTLYWKLHSLPERMAHKSQKLQFEVVAVLGLISLFTHEHIFWVAGLLLAMIDLPDFGSPMRSIAGSLERIADATPGAPPADPNAEIGNSGAQTPAKEGGHHA
jgi:hypothetical protein